MFKRRKTEEPSAQPARGQITPPASPALDLPGMNREETRPDADAASPIGGAVPSIPTMPAQVAKSPTAAPASFQTKEPPLMSRPPLQQPPSSQPTTPMQPARASLTPSRAPAREGGERRTLVVGRGISVQGTILDAERLVVDGTVEASSLRATELQITHGGVLKGQVDVEDAEISGHMDGTLTVRGSLVIRGSGQITGEARCRRLQVEDGGQLTGKISMITDDTPPPPVSDTPATAG